MSTTPSGTITASDVRTALNVTNNSSGSTNYPTNTISFSDSLVRTLASKSTNAISMYDMRGKAGPGAYGTVYNNDPGVCGLAGQLSSTFSQKLNDGKFGWFYQHTLNACTVTLTPITYSTNTADASINISSLSGYSAGISSLTITVNSGIYVYATSTGNAGLTITGGTTGDKITLINNGYIIGKGGDAPYTQTAGDGVPGGPALSVGCAIEVNNKSGAYIAGGGGSGANSGGGGAGGGNGGGSPFWSAGGAGGAPGQTGASGGTGGTGGNATYYGPGGGGRILPGVGGSPPNGGGGAGGAGGGNAQGQGAGGSAGNAGGAGQPNGGSGGGGGGWGAKGGDAGATGYTHAGGAGGAAITVTNNATVTYTSGATGIFYGTKP